MAIKPGPVSFTLGAYSLLADSISLAYDVEFFDRVEFDHDKLKTAPLQSGVQPIVVTLLGGVPAEIAIGCAVNTFANGASSYIPRPLTPNIYPTGFDSIKKRFNTIKTQIVGGQDPSSAMPAATVDAILAIRESHRNMLAQFQNRLAILNTTVSYEALLAAQADNIQALYFTTGLTLTAPGLTVNQVLITDFQETHEFVIPNNISGFDIYKGFSITLEQRTVVAASSS